MPTTPGTKKTILAGNSVAKSVYSSTVATANLLNSYDTSPRVTWASSGEYLVADTGISTSDQFFATRVKTRISGGEWLALAPVFVCAALVPLKSPFGVVNQPKVTFSWNLELANGTLTAGSYLSPNTGGTVLPGFINGQADGIMQGGGILVGDFIYASSASLPYFQWNDRSLLPWVRVAWSKKNATDALFAATTTEYNFPSNSHYATCTSYSAAKTLIATSGISNYNGGNNFWSAGDSATLPTCIGFIGIPLDNQKSFVFFGTSILDGDGNASHVNGGVDPANNSIANYDLLGFPNIFGENIANSVPVLNLAVGGSAASCTWSGFSTNTDWVTNPEDISLHRCIVSQLAKYFDYCVPYDVHNDADATFSECIYNFVAFIRSSNPGIKIYACRVPNGYVDVSGSSLPYATGLDVRWTMYDNAVSSGLIHGVLTVREGGNIFFDAGTQVTGTTSAVGTTTTIVDATATWLPNQWINSFASVGGIQRLITGNSRTTLTTTAFGAAPGSGTTYLIQGNTSGDGLHPNAFGQRRLANNFKNAIGAAESVPYFTRTS